MSFVSGACQRMTFSSLFLEILSIIDLPYWKWNAVFFPRDLRVSERDLPLFTSAMQLCKFRLQSFVGWKRSTDCIKKIATASTTTIYELERSFSCFGKCYGSLMLLLIERIVNLQSKLICCELQCHQILTMFYLWRVFQFSRELPRI